MLASHKSILVFLLYNFGNIGYVLTVLYCFILLLFRGRQVLVFLHDQHFRSDSKTERWIGIKTLIIQFGLSCIIEVLLFPLFRFFTKGYFFQDLYQLVHTIMYVFIFNTKISLIGLMVYQSYSIEAELKHLTESFTSLKQLTVTFELVLQLQRTMKMFNKFISQFIVLSITFNSICTITYINLLYFETFSKLDFSLGGIAECLSPLFIICYFSNKAIHNYHKLLDKFEDLELQNTKAGFNYKVIIDFSIVNKLYSIKDILCFTAFGFKIHIKTFLSVISIIITFSVILMIQMVN